MKVEMEGKEPFVILFGVPLLTTAIVAGAMYLGQRSMVVVPPPPIHVDAPSVSPQINAVLPEGSVQVHNQVPPAQIREVVKEVVRPPEPRESREDARVPESQVTFPAPPAKPKPPVTPTPAAVVDPLEADPAAEAEAAGILLPPPEDAKTRPNRKPDLKTE
ncbi:MAG: hypothetical protein M5U26_10240 [Planctomycetota bacterium]|nr:hypothetical protein [Planctomycetota bacterium]